MTLWHVLNKLFILLLSSVTVLAVLAKTSHAQSAIPTDVTVYRGEQVTLNCSGTKLNWSHLPSGNKLFTSPDIWSSTERNKYDIVGNYYLVIKDAEPSDGGRYQCDTDDNMSHLLFADVVVLGNVSLKYVRSS